MPKLYPEIPADKKLIVIEGVDGSGKTTLSKRVAELLAARDLGRVHWTCQPTHIGAGELIRKKLATHSAAELLADEARVELALLFAADRIEHWRQIRALFSSGVEVVVCDRWYHSSLVYQGYAARADWMLVRLANQLAPTPTPTFILDIAPELAHARASARRGGEVFTRANIEFFARLYRDLPAMLEREGHREPVAVLPGQLPTDELAAAILERIDALK